MPTDKFTESAIAIRCMSTDVTWAKICDVLINANANDSLDEIMAKMPLTINSDLFFVLKSCLQVSMALHEWTIIGYCLAAAGRVYETLNDAQTIEMVWSGPNAGVFPARRIDQVLYDLVNVAKSKILIVTFAAARIKLLKEALHEAIRRGVEVNLILEFEEESEGQLTFSALKAFTGSLYDKVGIYSWPNENRERNAQGKPGKLHAKCAIIDNSALISSANLTDDAFNRNMELGILLKGGDIPRLIRQHFEAMITNKILVIHS